ncbi:hypothetical protein QVG61_11385 [Thiohalobacter sp. IOR34]|uniref:hypothetical protein n=1 Tax=Thiohalobacter sp. IOR34 TaxID=3057176 RepID=UPI0025B0E521|nr:hypothetical protein [Thiohalobacter sp. IOR34]WJW75086.1 hypothetical protein QVG61_11385 [Thiohalobacter sp. IOR34]
MLRAAGQDGFSLTELLIGSTLGLLVLGGGLQMYLANLQASHDCLSHARLSHELQTALELMTAELRRSGYWAGQPGIDPRSANPFLQTEQQLRIGQAAGESRDSCVLYSYDRNQDKRLGVGHGASGALQSAANVERFGFRLYRQRLQMRLGGRGFDCDHGQWQSLTSDDTEVTRLRFTRLERCLNAVNPGHPCTQGHPAQFLQQVDIELHGRSRSRGAPQQLTNRVRLRNNRHVARLP